MKFAHILQAMIRLITRVVISTILVLSAVGKLTEHQASALGLSQLFELPAILDEMVVIIWSIFEVGLSMLIWRPRISRIILAVPLVLLVVTLFSFWRNLDCGCFGSLSLLNEFSFGGHLLLLAGMFFSLFYLTASPKATKMDADDQNSRTLRWTGLTGIVMMLSAFLTLPFTSSDSRASNHSSNDTVDRVVVEAAIANHSAIIIDARPDFQYELSHLPSAINIPYDSNNLAELVNTHALKNQALIVYCSSPHCNAAEVLAEELRVLGYEKVSVYPGGWEEWAARANNFPN